MASLPPPRPPPPPRRSAWHRFVRWTEQRKVLLPVIAAVIVASVIIGGQSPLVWLIEWLDDIVNHKP